MREERRSGTGGRAQEANSALHRPASPVPGAVS
jgi:hypothetical protein